MVRHRSNLPWFFSRDIRQYNDSSRRELHRCNVLRYVAESLALCAHRWGRIPMGTVRHGYDDATVNYAANACKTGLCKAGWQFVRRLWNARVNRVSRETLD